MDLLLASEHDIMKLTMISKKLLGFIVFTMALFSVYSQTTTTFNYTGGSQTWTVPQCVTSIDVTVAGAEGGGSQIQPGAGTGGDGAVITMTVTVSPGDVITMIVGGAGGCGNNSGGFNGGGTGWASSNGNNNYNACGGGGATNFQINGVDYIIAAGGGGSGGGSVTNNIGGNGGCASGTNGGNTYGQGGGGASQSSGGSYGAPWAGTPGSPAGGPGSLGQGGNGGMWQTASGGGGGGGYYGGGGGGNDGCCTGANGGGGGGGGSSLVPAGAGCTAGANTGDGYVSITYVGGLSATATNTGPYCSDETIQLNATGGTDYSWTGPNGFTSLLQNPTIPNSTVADAGTYTVTVTDTGCPGTATASTTVVVNQSPTVDPIADQTLCNGSPTTAVNFTGNVPGATYNWNNNNTATGLGPAGTGNIPSFTGTASGTTQVSTVTVTATSNGCTSPPESFDITVLLDPSITVSNDTTVCENGTASLLANASGGGGGPYLYHWDFTPDTQPSQSVSPVNPGGSYTVYAESANGCFSQPLTIDVSMYPPLTGTITPNDTICPGYPTDITATVTGGIGQPYDFVWSSGETQTGPQTSMTISANPASTQNYIVTITDQCESTPLVMQTNIRVAPLPVPQYEVLDPEQCEPAVFHIANTTPDSLSQYVYWEVEDEYIYVNQDTIATPAFMEGTYSFQMIVTTYEGCIDSLTFYNALEVKPRPTAYFNHSPNPVTEYNNEVFFQNNSVLGYTYEWYFQDGTPSMSTDENVYVQFPYGETGSYEVILVTTSELGCTDTMVYQLIVFPEVQIYAPNSFTPDGDEYNQDWQIFMTGIDVYNFELLIFNRWGEIIWESHDIDVAWDGTYNGKKVKADTYTWVVRAKNVLNDEKLTYSGHVTILK